MARRRRRIRISRWMLPYLAAILVLSIFVTAAVLYRPSPNQEPPKKAAAKDYFQAINATTDNFDVQAWKDSNGTSILVSSLMFQIKAVGGPAHEVTVTGFSDAQPADSLPFNIAQNQYGFIQLSASSKAPVQSDLDIEKAGFPFTVYVTSLEAEGEITVYLTLQP